MGKTKTKTRPERATHAPNTLELVRVERDGPNSFAMVVKLSDGERERWEYERIEHSDGCVAYELVGRE